MSTRTMLLHKWNLWIPAGALFSLDIHIIPRSLASVFIVMLDHIRQEKLKIRNQFSLWAWWLILMKHNFTSNRSPAQAGCMRQVLRPGALGRPRGIGWRARCEGGSGWGIHVNPWLIHVNVWQKPLQYCKVISLQLIKNERKISPLEKKMCSSCYLN